MRKHALFDLLRHFNTNDSVLLPFFVFELTIASHARMTRLHTPPVLSVAILFIPPICQYL